MQHFSLTDLRVFSAVADERNLTRAAEHVHLSPSSVCARIKALESALRVPLFIRTPQGMETTDAGEIVRQGVRRIEREINGMLESLEPFVSQAAGTLRIATNYGAALNFLADGLARFLRVNPEVTVTQQRCSSREVVEAVAEDRADIGIGAYEGDYPGIEFLDYERDDLVLVVSRDHPFAARKSIAFAECLDENFVCLNETVEMQRFADEKARELGRRIHPKVRASNQPILFEMVAAGVGVGVASRVTFEAQPHPKARAVPLTNDWAKRRIRIALPVDSARRIRWAQELAETLRSGCPNAS